MTLDVLHFIDNKGGNAEQIRESQRKRGLSVELVDEVIQMYTDWVKMDYDASQFSKEVNAVQKEIAAKKKAKENADELVAKKKDLDAKVIAKRQEAKEQEQKMRQRAGNVGNIVGKDAPVSLTEDDNVTVRTYHPDGEGVQVEKKTDIMPHHEVLLRLDAMDLERGSKNVGHRGYYLTNDGIDLNQALINYGLDFLRKREYKKIQPPFMINKDVMAKTAQLDQFDEELYKVIADDDEKYLIATSEQPISAFHSDEWFESPETQLPIKYAGYSTCFRKEAGASGRDMWGIFRVHQFEKVEQFCITDPEKSWEMFDQMIATSEDFYKSLKIPYRVVAIVSGALNLAAAQKYDLEAWFPFQGAFKELVSCSNCTDYQSRRLEVRCGLRTKDQTRKLYVHMLNGTLCATERALCCVAENYQTPEGLIVPEVLRPYMQGRDFLPWVKELPKGLHRKQIGRKRRYSSTEPDEDESSSSAPKRHRLDTIEPEQGASRQEEGEGVKEVTEGVQGVEIEAEKKTIDEIAVAVPAAAVPLPDSPVLEAQQESTEVMDASEDVVSAQEPVEEKDDADVVVPSEEATELVLENDVHVEKSEESTSAAPASVVVSVSATESDAPLEEQDEAVTASTEQVIQKEALSTKIIETVSAQDH
ncbi:hypothetical protein EUX98_g5207 [Antrodiella citrinella]|uniref:serine--tRNA ligase n=1 Tax=Antrodiella citrinella TaxID=2447956 RepID=A0A4S4MTZ1_9APHY|nr:hypothetical protein EUX98_g5207 [Antrodiella citrinella]